jgi:hypothetical protein
VHAFRALARWSLSNAYLAGVLNALKWAVSLVFSIILWYRRSISYAIAIGEAFLILFSAFDDAF